MTLGTYTVSVTKLVVIKFGWGPDSVDRVGRTLNKEEGEGAVEPLKRDRRIEDVPELYVTLVRRFVKLGTIHLSSAHSVSDFFPVVFHCNNLQTRVGSPS